MLTAEQRSRGQRRLLWFGFFNSLSFTLLTGNMISLYLLRLGASNGLIGVIASFSYVAFFMLFLGRTLVPRVGVIRLFAWAWLYRYIVFIPVLLAPVFLLSQSRQVVYLLVGAGVLGFHVARGIGLVANTPLFSGFAGPAERGRFLSQFLMVGSTAYISMGILIAILLGERAGIGRYVLFLGAGVAAGIVATGVLFGIPELEEEKESARRPIGPIIRELFGHSQMRRYFLAFFLVAFAAGIGRSFLVVFAKQAHGYTDRLAFLMVTIGSVGNFLSGYLGSILLDRLGARPLILFSLVTYIASLILAVVLPVAGGFALVVAMGVLFFAATLGYTGMENSFQAYFFGMTSKDDRLNLGIIFYLTLGSGGLVGSFSGGFVLDALSTVMAPAPAFRLFFLVVAGIAAVACIRARGLPSLGAETFRGTMEVIFSPRDLRTVGLLNRLSRTRGVEEEQTALRTLAHSHSPRALGEVLERLESPSYAIRQEALEALSTLPYTPEVEWALVQHLTSALHTTAFMAVRILGLRGGPDAIEPVRQAVYSEDRLLAERAVVALARLAGTAALPVLREQLAAEDSPRFLLHVAVAIQTAGGPDELPPLLEQLGRRRLPDYVVDEILFAAAHIQGIFHSFYPFYSGFIRDRTPSQRKALCDEVIALIAEHVTGETAERLTAATEHLLIGDPPTETRRVHRALDQILRPEPLLDEPLRSLTGVLPVRGRVIFFYIFVCIHR
ncbi:MAG: MFS transporter [Alkalispirochaeta sp.]